VITSVQASSLDDVPRRQSPLKNSPIPSSLMCTRLFCAGLTSTSAPDAARSHESTRAETLPPRLLFDLPHARMSSFATPRQSAPPNRA